MIEAETNTKKERNYIEQKKSQVESGLLKLNEESENSYFEYLQKCEKRSSYVETTKKSIADAVTHEQKKVISDAKSKALAKALLLEGYGKSINYALLFIPIFVAVFVSLMAAVILYGVLVAFNYQKCVKFLSESKLFALNELNKREFTAWYKTNLDVPTKENFEVMYVAPDAEFVDDQTGKKTYKSYFDLGENKNSGSLQKKLGIAFYKVKDDCIEFVRGADKKLVLAASGANIIENDYLNKFASSIDYNLDDAQQIFLDLQEALCKVERIEIQIAAMQKRLQSLQDFEKIWDGVVISDEILDGILNRIDLFVARSPVAPKGILLYGPPGTGKTLIAKNISKSMGCSFYPVSLSTIKGAYIGHSSKHVGEIWEKAIKNKPSIIFVDECDAIFKTRNGVNTDSFVDDIVNEFIQRWDGLTDSSGVLVIGATNRRDDLDSAVLSRFNAVIEIPLPNSECRQKIIQNQLKKIGSSLSDCTTIVKETQGFSGRDIQNLVSTLASEATGTEYSKNDILRAIKSARSKNSTNVTQLSWEDVVLDSDFKSQLEVLSKTIRNAEVLESKGIGVPKSMLLYGPPGTGKTQIAKVLANESGLSFISATTADLKAGYLGQATQKTKELFERARSQSPCILFIDEIDIIAPARGDGSEDKLTNEIVGQLLQEMDGFAKRSGRLFVMAATNSLQGIDSAVRSRFQEKIEIPLPTEENRIKILDLGFRGKPCSFDIKAASKEIAQRTNGYSGRDLVSLVSQVEKNAVSRHMAGSDEVSDLVITQLDIDKTLSEI